MPSIKKYLSLAIASCFVKQGYCQVTPNGASQPSAQQVYYLPPALSAAAKINYVRTWEPWKPISNPDSVLVQTVDKVKQTTAFVDGLGRAVQTVTKQISPAQKDMVAYKTFDDYGRETMQYLSYVSDSTNGYFKTNPFLEQKDYFSNPSKTNNQYIGEQVYYGRTAFEPSPLNRPDSVMAVGNSWAGSNRGIITRYLFNTVSDSVRIWTVAEAIGSTPATSATYDNGQLHKTVAIDEHGKQVVEYKDKEGKVILKKVQLLNSPGAGHYGWLCTYYIYDVYGQLRCVIQPKGVELLSSNWSLTSTLFDEQCFRYEYDQRNRLIIKKVPGAGEVWMVYDALDRLVMSQDSMLRAQGKWLYTQYDKMDRPFSTGLLISSANRTTHQAAAYNSTSYPAYDQNYSMELTHNFFDDYSYGGAKTWDNNDVSKLNAGQNPNPEAVGKSELTYGLITGSSVTILGTTNFMMTTTYYDNKGRAQQLLSDNERGGVDILTNQYNFTGKLLSSYLKHNNPSCLQTPTIRVLTKMQYDQDGRLLKIWKQINDNGADKQIAENSYDELGKLKSKKLAPAYNSNVGLETLNYEYSLRGWLRGINKDYGNNANNTNWFGMEVSYDFGFNSAQYNGNISGIKWRSKGDGEQRAYGFTYDAVNRLTQADFTQYTPGGFNNWNTSAGVDFSVSNLSYDANGNILSMNQQGLKLSGSSYVDQLTYTYQGSGFSGPESNKLKQVTDAANDNNSFLGDFKYDPSTKGFADYSYDGNGNLISDNNKSISNIHYNVLNLPDSITVTGKGTIKYQYDAAGNKLKKIAVDGANTTITSYIGAFVYQNDTLQFISHEEGRIRRKIDSSFDFDYFIKDHLGNVRMVLTEEQKQDIYPAATLESTTYNGGTAVSNEDDYYTIDPSAVVDKSDATNIPNYQNNNGIANPNTYSNTTANSGKLYKLGIVPGHPNLGNIGLGITLRVMSGDKIDIFGKSYYYTSNSGGTNYSLPVTSIISGLLGSPGGATAGSHATATDLNSNSTILNALDAFVNDANRNNGGTSTTPKAYINYILFDEHFKFVAGGFSRVYSSSGSVKDHYGDAAMQNIPVTKNGYIYVYCSNQSPVSVYFDNLQVIHTRGPLIEETHYYPFGLTMSGISSKAMVFGQPENRNKFNGIEQNKDFDLNMYDAHYRNLDPQIGKFWQIDPKPNETVSPYAAMMNNPVLYSDPLGDTTWVYGRNGALIVIIADGLKNQVHFMGYDWSGKPYAMYTEKNANEVGEAWRNSSIAFIGEQTIAEMRDIVNAALKTNPPREVFFTGTVTKTKEIKLEALKTKDGSYAGIDNVDKIIDEKFQKSDQANLFIVGHVHLGQTPSKNSPFIATDDPVHEFGRPTPPDGDIETNDYGPYIYRSANATQRGQSAALVLSRYGVTVYGTLSAPAYFMSETNSYFYPGKFTPGRESYFSYQQLKR